MALGAAFAAPAAGSPAWDSASAGSTTSDSPAASATTGTYPARGAAAGQSPAFAAADAAGAPDGSPTIVERVEYRQLDDGTLEATVIYELPDSVSDLEFRFERGYHDVVATEGFERRGDAALSWSEPGPVYAWDGESGAPRVVIRHEPTVGEPAEYAGGADDWAVVLRPPTATRWRYDGATPSFAYDAAVPGEGAAGERFLVLGGHEVHETEVDGERIRLVVPDAAEPAASPERLLDTLADASDRLRVGERNDVVTVVAAPAAVDWKHRGLSLGPDARVSADLAPDAAPSLWVHEYVHTRQDRASTTRETAWLVEATAEYYATAIPLARGDVDYADYRRTLEYGSTGIPAEAVLAEPASWRAQAQYQKGALVVAATDRELRAATDGEATFQDVVRAWNDADAFDQSAFAARLEALGGASVREYGVRLATTNATPTAWDRERHERVFGVGATAGGASAHGDGAGGSAAGPVQVARDRVDAGAHVRALVGALRRTAGEWLTAAGSLSAVGASAATDLAAAAGSLAGDRERPALPDLHWLGVVGSVLVAGGVAVRR